MQENNESDENTQNETTDQGPSAAPPVVGGDVFHPETSEEPLPPVAETPDTSADVEPAAPEEKPELLAVPPQPHTKKSKKGPVVIIILLLLAAAGVGAWWMTKDKTNKPNSNVAKSTETQDIDVLKIGSGEGPASVYFPDEGLLGVQTNLDHQIYEGLVGFEKNTIKPLIAQSWTNPDEKTWVFKIHPNIKFHTGKEAKAKEIKAALDDLKKYEYWSLFVSTIDSVEATGDLELTIKTKDPDSLLLNRLSQAYISDITAADKLGNNGTGAYHVDATAKNDEKSTTLVAFDEYYGGHIKTRKVVYVIYETDEAIAKAYKAKEIDVAATVPIPSVKKEIEGADYSSLEYQSPGAFGLYMNQKRSATTVFKNKDIRLAAAQAMDRQGLIDKVGNKNTPSTQVIPKSLAGYDESISFPAFDLAAAKASLARGGYKNTPLEFVYIKELQQDAPIIIEQLKAAGFNIKERAYVGDDTAKALAELRAGRFDFVAAGYSSDVADARDILGGILSSTESTYPVYSDPAYDKLLTDSDKEFDPVKRIQLLQQANKYIVDNISWIPLRNGTYVSYFSKDLDITLDFNGGGNLGVYYRKVGRIAQ